MRCICISRWHDPLDGNSAGNWTTCTRLIFVLIDLIKAGKKCQIQLIFLHVRRNINGSALRAFDTRFEEYISEVMYPTVLYQFKHLFPLQLSQKHFGIRLQTAYLLQYLKINISFGRHQTSNSEKPN